MTSTPKRPCVTDEMVREAAIELLNSYDQDASGADDIVKNYTHWMDGYELAKALDDYCYWSVDARMVEILDDLPSRVQKILEKAQKEWATEYNIQPKLGIGVKVARGVIAGIYEHGPASYKVKEHGCTNDGRHLIIPFEEAESGIKD